MKTRSAHAWLLRALVLISLLSLLLVTGVSSISVYLLAKPRKLDFPPIPSPYENVKFPTHGNGELQVAGWYLPRSGNKTAVILVHGKDMSKGTEFQCRFADFGKALHSEGLSVLLIDLRGHGNSDNSFISFGLDERNDIIGAADGLKSHGYAPGTIGVLGVSMGAASAIGATGMKTGQCTENTTFLAYQIYQTHLRLRLLFATHIVTLPGFSPRDGALKGRRGFRAPDVPLGTTDFELLSLHHSPK